MFEDLSRRRSAPEIMDGPDLDPAEHHAALNGLERLNLLALQARPFWREIAPLAAEDGKPLRVLDLACGGGGLVCGLRKRALRAGIEMIVDGCDRSPLAVEHATARAERQGLRKGRYFEWDMLQNGTPEGYDVVTNTLFLHHLSESEVTAFLIGVRERVHRLVLISDILRSQVGLLMVHAACRTLGGSRVVVEDGLTSLRAAFTEAELAALAQGAGLTGATLRRHWPERAMIRWERRA